VVKLTSRAFAAIRKLRAAQGLTSLIGRKQGPSDADPTDMTADELMALDPADLVQRGYGVDAVTSALILQRITSGDCTASEVQAAFRATVESNRTQEFHLLVGETLIQKGEPLMAEEILYLATKTFKQHTYVRVRQLHGLALAQGGSTLRAIEALEQLQAEGAMDDESGGLLARCYKDLAARERNAEGRTNLLNRAHAIYKEAFESGGRASYYTGINTATMALLTGRTVEAMAMADEVIALCRTEFEASIAKAGGPPSEPPTSLGRDDLLDRLKPVLQAGHYWALATVGEAYIIIGDFDAASDFYAAARSCAGDNFVKLASTQKQLRLLLKHKIESGLGPPARRALARGEAAATRRAWALAGISEEDDSPAALRERENIQVRVRSLLFDTRRAIEREHDRIVGNTRHSHGRRSSLPGTFSVGKLRGDMKLRVTRSQGPGAGGLGLSMDDVVGDGTVVDSSPTKPVPDAPSKWPTPSKKREGGSVRFLHQENSPPTGSGKKTPFSKLNFSTDQVVEEPDDLDDDDNESVAQQEAETQSRREIQECAMLASDGPFACMINLPSVTVFLSSEADDGIVTPSPHSEEALRTQIRACLGATQTKFVYASPCSLADIVFLETAHSLGCELYIVLPVPMDVHLRWCTEMFREMERYGSTRADIHLRSHADTRLHKEFPELRPESLMSPSKPNQPRATGRRKSLIFSTSELIQRLRDVLSVAARVDVSNDMSPEMTVTNRHYCSLILDGLARMRAQLVGTSVVRLYSHGVVLRSSETVEQWLDNRPLLGETVNAEGVTPRGLQLLPYLSNPSSSPAYSSFLTASGLFPGDASDSDDEELGEKPLPSPTRPSALRHQMESTEEESIGPRGHSLTNSPKHAAASSGTGFSSSSKAHVGVTTTATTPVSSTEASGAPRKKTTPRSAIVWQSSLRPDESSVDPSVSRALWSSLEKPYNSSSSGRPPLARILRSDAGGRSRGTGGPMGPGSLSWQHQDEDSEEERRRVKRRTRGRRHSFAALSPVEDDELHVLRSEAQKTIAVAAARGNTGQFIADAVIAGARAAGKLQEGDDGLGPPKEVGGKRTDRAFSGDAGHLYGISGPSAATSSAAARNASPGIAASGRRVGTRIDSGDSLMTPGYIGPSNRSRLSTGGATNVTIPESAEDAKGGDFDHLGGERAKTPPKDLPGQMNERRRGERPGTPPREAGGREERRLGARDDPRSALAALFAAPLAVEHWTQHHTVFRVIGCPYSIREEAQPRLLKMLPQKALRAAHRAKAMGSEIDVTRVVGRDHPEASVARAMMDADSASVSETHEDDPDGLTRKDIEAAAKAERMGDISSYDSEEGAEPPAAESKAKDSAAPVSMPSLHQIVSTATVRSALDNNLSRAFELLVPAFQAHAKGMGASAAGMVSDQAVLGRLLTGKAVRLSDTPTLTAAPDASLMAAHGLPVALPNPPPRRQVIAAPLFADVVNFSKLSEPQVLVFIENVLGAIANLIDSMPRRARPKIQQTWGDALYGVWARVPDAGEFALMLSDLVAKVPWHTLGLPNNLNIRISLHAAPVHVVTDPILRLKNFTGVHTSRAARIEPITPPGSVYCTQAFAAISEMLGVRSYECTYVGNVPLAKKYGMQPVYAVRWRSSSQSVPRLLHQRLREKLKKLALRAKLRKPSAKTMQQASNE
jgi:hypothetical protein